MASFEAEANAFVVPGQYISTDAGFLRGRGAYIENDGEEQHLVASLAGKIERINKLISVRPVTARYVGEIGDLVVGRITSVESKRWKVDINAQRDAVLQLSSVNLPGGEQRMRNQEDMLQMRSLFEEGDLISAEIQNINGSDGLLSLHTRSMKYGKLDNGQCIQVHAQLIPRLPQHYVSLPWGLDIILGNNGFIWITRTIPEEWKLQDEDSRDNITPLAETLEKLRQKHAETPLLTDERRRTARVKNVISILSSEHQLISPEHICKLYQISEALELEPMAMTHPAGKQLILERWGQQGKHIAGSAV